MSKNSRRISWMEADDIKKLIDGLAEDAGIKVYQVAGSYRRKKDTCGDIDLCVREMDYGKWAVAIRTLAKTGEDVLIKQKDGTVTGVMYDGTRIEFYVAQKDAFGAMLLFCTGSWEFNVMQRNVAIGKGMKLNEKGLFVSAAKMSMVTRPDPKQSGAMLMNTCKHRDTGKEYPVQFYDEEWVKIAGKLEVEIFDALEMPWREPEQREV